MTNQSKIQTLKGFRDFLPEQAKKRQYVIDTLKKVFESYGFEPLETPTLEYAEVLTGKYGDEGEKLMYKFKDRGDREVAMRYDQTVPLARVIAQYQNITFPFKRYQIQPVWRADKPQKGRYREFLQCDIDIVGSKSPVADAEILALVYNAYKALGLNFSIQINDRDIFEGVNPAYLPIIDKLEKIGEEGVLKELSDAGEKDPKKILSTISSKKETALITQIKELYSEMGAPEESLKYVPTLVRGLDYYTGLIIEVVVKDYSAGSVGGGGRYDKLLSLFSKNEYPSVGFSFGFDRTVEAMEEKDLFPKDLEESTSKVLVTVFNAELLRESLKVTSALRDKGLCAEVYLDQEAKMEKQLKYADKKKVPYVVIIGPEEIKTDKLKLKDMKKREETLLTMPELLKELS